MVWRIVSRNVEIRFVSCGLLKLNRFAIEPISILFCHKTSIPPQDHFATHPLPHPPTSCVAVSKFSMLMSFEERYSVTLYTKPEHGTNTPLNRSPCGDLEDKRRMHRCVHRIHCVRAVTRIIRSFQRNPSKLPLLPSFQFRLLGRPSGVDLTANHRPASHV